jgi:hypothetical protein
VEVFEYDGFHARIYVEQTIFRMEVIGETAGLRRTERRTKRRRGFGQKSG